jgi:hypothetical protein
MYRPPAATSPFHYAEARLAAAGLGGCAGDGRRDLADGTGQGAWRGRTGAHGLLRERGRA